MRHIELYAQGARMAAFGLDHFDAGRLAPLGANAAHLGLSPPPESESAHVASAGRFEEQQIENRNCDSVPAADQVASDVAEHQAEANMRARAARAGCGLHHLADGGWLLSRWGLSRELPDLRSVGALLTRLGGFA